MALLFMEGFEQYTLASSADLTASFYQLNHGLSCRWHGETLASSINTGTFRTTQPAGSSAALSLGSSASQYACLSMPLPSNIYVGFGYRINTLIDAKIILLTSTANDANATNGIYLQMNSNGSFSFVNAATSAVLLTTTTGLIPLSTWIHVEFHAVFSATGSLEIKVNGASVGSVSGIDTRGSIALAGYNYLSFCTTTGTTKLIDDFYICDDSGATNNNFLGQVRVFTVFPGANGSTNQMTPVGSASNFQCVDENEWNATDYLRTSTTGHIDYFNPTDIAGMTSVFAVSVGNVSLKNDNGARQVRNKLKISSDVSNGITSRPTYGVYKCSQDIFPTQPDGSAWSVAAVNSMEIGVESV